jgi:hypothetical protein
MTRNFFHSVVSSRVFVSLLVMVAGRGVFAGEPQDYKTYEYTSPTSFHQPVPPLPVEFGFSQHHSSTAAEGFLRGKAAVIQAQGNFLLSKSQATILFEQARALDRENDLRQTQALLAQHAMWREGRYAERREFEARREAGRAKIEARRQMVHRAAYQLSPEDLNPATGEIRWPVALQSTKFAGEREKLDELMRQHVGYGSSQADVSAEIARLTKDMATSLRSEIRNLAKDEYIAAQKFLLGLKLEVGNVQG